MNTLQKIEISDRVATGHPAIDEQHARLAHLIASIDALCAFPIAVQDCAACTTTRHRECNRALADVIGEMLVFMVEHFQYEEALMRLLPKTLECSRHIEAHQKAHGDLTEYLSELTLKFDARNPLANSRQLHRLLHCWMGEHNERMDKQLVIALGDGAEVELELDRELVLLLATAGEPA